MPNFPAFTLRLIAITPWVLAFGLLANECFAQAVTPMEFEVQATMLAPQGEVSSCGVTFNGGAIRPGPTIEADQVAGSIAIHAKMPSLLKAGHQVVLLENGKPLRRHAGDQIAWVRIEGGVPLASIDGRMVPSDDPSFHLFAVKTQSALDGMLAMLEGKTIWVGFSKNGVTTNIFSGRVKQDLAVIQQFRSCLVEMTGAPAKKP